MQNIQKLYLLFILISMGCIVWITCRSTKILYQNLPTEKQTKRVPTENLAQSLPTEKLTQSLPDKKLSQNFQWPKIYIYGDSLTQKAFSKDGGWASILSDALTRNADVIARGFSGYNTRHSKALLPYLDNDLKDTSIAGIFLGANDATLPTADAPQRVPVEEYKDNLKYMIKYMRKFDNIKTIFLVTPPALGEEQWNAIENYYRKSNELTDRYISACIETAKEMGVPYIDVQSAMLLRDDWKDLLRDGLHFNQRGSEFFASLMLPRLKEMLKENNIGGGVDGLFPNPDQFNVDDPNASVIELFKSQEL